MQNGQFIWETHGIHTGTGNDPVKHGVDEIEIITEKAISLNHPNITFIIHTPRLTKFRYQSEEHTNIKFIRGSEAYQNYTQKITDLREKYRAKINIKYGIELEWLGSKLGLQWNRSKILQVPDADFVIGSVHFSNEGVSYDGSKEEAQKLLKIRGSLENYWAAYFDELIEMVSYSSSMIHAVGHLDLPKVYVDFPHEFTELDNADNIVCDRLRVLLETISENNLALDLNLAGIKKGCGIYPNLPILKRARVLKIPIAIGTDTHNIDEYGKFYGEGIAYAKKAGYSQYVSFSRGIPEIRPFSYENSEDVDNYKALNLSIEILNRRFSASDSGRIPRFAFGGKYLSFINQYDGATPLGNLSAIRIRRERKSIMIGSDFQQERLKNEMGILLKHYNKPGVLSVLFNTLASEGINVKTAFLNSENDDVSEAFLTVSGAEESIVEAIEFANGTEKNNFISIEFGSKISIPLIKKHKYYLLEMDGVKLPIPISKNMILAVINNKPGVLLILLSALASRNINIIDLQLGERGDKGFAALSYDGDFGVVEDMLRKLGDQYYETTHFQLSAL
ncbi:MAG: histidinol-phosphatase HisJ family protein [Chitinispirillales bacterium]|jgi:histidinol-phosphatase (PHP family)|nr:histidinol-phosphatase HisJ family protein [Chitinispirillales bacterium]